MKQLLLKIRENAVSKLYIDPLRKTYNRAYLCAILWLTNPEWVKSVIKEVNEVRYVKKHIENRLEEVNIEM